MTSLALVACSVCAQQAGEVAIEARTEPASRSIRLSESDIRQLAAESPQQPVAITVNLVPGATLETVADFVFEKRIEAISVYSRDHITGNRYRMSGYTLSALGPARAEQLARAKCHLGTGSEITEAGADEPPQADARRVMASLLLSAREAARWMERTPAIVTSIDGVTAPDATALALTREITRNVLTLRLPAGRGVQVPPGCEKFLSSMTG